MSVINPRSITDSEAPFLPATVDDLAELGRLLEEEGHSPAIVQGILGWLTLKAAGVPDRTSQVTRAKYRRVLAELQTVGPKTPDGGRRSQGGWSSVFALAGISAAAGAGIVAHDPKASAVISGLLYITYKDGDGALEAQSGGGVVVEMRSRCAHSEPGMHTSSTLRAAA